VPTRDPVIVPVRDPVIVPVRDPVIVPVRDPVIVPTRAVPVVLDPEIVPPYVICTRLSVNSPAEMMCVTLVMLILLSKQR
jgi:hypothetical protein